MRIKRLSLKDYRSVRDIFHDAFDKERLPVSDLGISWRARASEHSWGVFNGTGELLAFAVISFHTKNRENRYIDYIAVHSAYRGQGIGDILMNHILRICRSQHTSVHLYPLKHEPLIKWYKKFGFYETHGGYLNYHSYLMRRRRVNPLQEEV